MIVLTNENTWINYYFILGIMVFLQVHHGSKIALPLWFAKNSNQCTWANSRRLLINNDALFHIFHFQKHIIINKLSQKKINFKRKLTFKLLKSWFIYNHSKVIFLACNQIWVLYNLHILHHHTQTTVYCERLWRNSQFVSQLSSKESFINSFY